MKQTVKKISGGVRVILALIVTHIVVFLIMGTAFVYLQPERVPLIVSNDNPGIAIDAFMISTALLLTAISSSFSGWKSFM